ncbi:hypothetical protein ECA02_34780 [Enterococcus casseliflavus]|nr:hypothetical protein ECA02_34780 [Enterococcus casseliflavus]
MGLGVAQKSVTWAHVTMLAKEKKTHYETPKRIFLSIAGCVVDQKFVSIILDIAITVLISPADFFAGDLFVKVTTSPS